MALQETSRAAISRTKNRNQRNNRGFTLLEILLVMGLIAFVITMGVRKLQNPNTALKQAVKQIATISRELHVRSKLSGVTFRLAFEMNAKKPDRLWVEASTQKITFPSEKELKEKASGRIKDPDKEPKSPFSIDKRVGSGGIRELPPNLKIKRIEYAQQENPVSGGMGYVHFLPEGIIEEAAIHIATEDDKLKWTIAIHPLTGRVDLLNGDMNLKEMREQ
jgi:general secretion pathway protein H